jgi:hypothetical protein
MKCSGSRILIPFSKSVILSKIVGLLFANISASHCSISINLHCAFAIVCTSVVYFMFNCTFVNSYSSCVTMLSSLASFYIVCASTKWCFIVSSSSDSSMYIEFIDVTPSLVYSLACQRCLLMRKNSTVYVPVISMSWIIICINYIFTLYTITNLPPLCMSAFTTP